MTFSINYPGKELARKADYCGIYSGKSVDKSAVFSVFNGALKGAPMIEQCFMTCELEVKGIVELESDCFIIGEMVNTYSDEGFLEDNRINPEKAESFFLSYPDFNYRTPGSTIGKAWNIGKKLDG